MPPKHPGADDDDVDDRDDVEDEDDDDGDVDIEGKQLLVGESTEIDGFEDPATETVNMFRVKVSANEISPSFLRLAAPRRRARGDSSNLIAEQLVWCDVVDERLVLDCGNDKSEDVPATGEGKTTLRDI
jgi:hypothetical protein